MRPQNTEQLLTQRFRRPKDIAVKADLSHGSGYFPFGSEAICYEYSAEIRAIRETDKVHVSSQYLHRNGSTVQLPLDPVQIVDNLRFERYVANATRGRKKLLTKTAVRNMYYLVRPYMAVAMRKQFQKVYLRGWDKIPFPAWPVDRTVENILEQFLVCEMRARNVKKVPFVWFWPDGAPSCTIVTHDVETSSGVEFCPHLMDLNDSFGIKASFQIGRAHV